MIKNQRRCYKNREIHENVSALTVETFDERLGANTFATGIHRDKKTTSKAKTLILKKLTIVKNKNNNFASR